MAFESLLVASPAALGAAALFAAVDVLGARSPYALAAAWLAPAAPPRVPGGPGRVAAIARAVVLAGATALLARDATVAAAVLAGIVVTEGLLAAILGRTVDGRSSNGVATDAVPVPAVASPARPLIPRVDGPRAWRPGVLADGRPPRRRGTSPSCQELVCGAFKNASPRR